MKHTLTLAEMRDVLSGYICHRDRVDGRAFPRCQMFWVGSASFVAREQLADQKNDDVVLEFEFYSGQIGQS